MKNFIILLVFIANVAFGSTYDQQKESPDVVQLLMQIKNNLERILNGNVIPFWHPNTVDRENGGYRLNHDINGQWQGPSDKYLVTQARMLWFFSRLYRSKYGSKEHLESARYGYEFLRDKMWDNEFGGFYWAVDFKGTKPTITCKHMYGQSFALYALSEYYMASGDKGALYLAKRLFNIMDFIAHDKVFGGYREFFLRNWSLPKDDDLSPLGTISDVKLMNTHLHLMEAMTVYYQASKDPIARERLIELIIIQSNSVVRKTIGACSDVHKLDWEPMRGPEYDRVSYGHDIENIWLLAEACEAVGLNNRLLIDLYQTLFQYSFEHGFDKEKGGFFSSGPFGSKADKLSKIWWVQAECMVGSLYLYTLTNEKVHFECFSKTLEWIIKNQVDWINGEWFEEITDKGERMGSKSGPWKSAYHNGRAILTSIELIDKLIIRFSKN